jgi:excisionase family DNA binding protein
MIEESWLVPKQVAGMLHLNCSFTCELIRRGDIRSIHIGRQIRIHPSEVERSLQERVRSARAWRRKRRLPWVAMFLIEPRAGVDVGE